MKFSLRKLQEVSHHGMKVSLKGKELGPGKEVEVGKNEKGRTRPADPGHHPCSHVREGARFSGCGRRLWVPPAWEGLILLLSEQTRAMLFLAHLLTRRRLWSTAHSLEQLSNLT